MLSLHEFNVTALKRALAARSTEAVIMDRGCASLGLEPSQFMVLFPAYLALFIRLKTALGYGPEGPRRAAAALADWIGAPPALSPPAPAAPAVEPKKTAQGVVRRSIAIAFAETYVMVAIQFLTSIIIARLLTPDEIGVFSVAVVAVSIAHTVREFGIVSYLIKEETLTDAKIRAASALSFVTSWTLGAIIFASSFSLASFYRDPRLLHLLWILALNFILIPFGSVVFAILRREMRMGAVFILRTISVLCGAAAAVTLAWLGFGPMSLALSLSVNLVAMVTLVQFYRPSDMPRMPSFRGAMSIVNFSAFSLTSSLATDVAKAAPDVVLGRVQSMTSVGLFGRAMGLVDMFSKLIENSIWSVSLPYFSRLKREAETSARRSPARKRTSADWRGRFTRCSHCPPDR
jgi:O-antigen/teichoic acid export membrane protein